MSYVKHKHFKVSVVSMLAYVHNAFLTSIGHSRAMSNFFQKL